MEHSPDPGTSYGQGMPTGRRPSFTGHAIVYLFFWLPGLILNIVFYSRAKKAEREAGATLPGVGCLAVMLWLNIVVFVIIPLVLVVLILLL